MKRKIFSGILAATLALATMSTCAFADEMTINGVTGTATSTEVTGGGTVIYAEDIYDVILPTNLSYAVDVNDVLGSSGRNVTNVEGSAIYSGNFGVINHSSTALQIDAKLKIEVAEDSDVVVTDKAVITANNAATDTSVISTDPYINLELAPVVSGTSVNADAVKVGNATYAAISGIQPADIATDDAIVLSSAANTMIFALTQASYEVSTHGVSIETTNGGFLVSGDAADIEKVYDGPGYTGDPVVAFTITGDVNKYAKWNNVVLPEVTAVFTLTPLTQLEWNSITFNPTADKVVSDGAVATEVTAYYYDDGKAAFISLVPVVNGEAVSDPGFTTIDKVSNIKINGKAATGTILANYLRIAYDQFTGTTAPFTITFTYNGTNYSVYAEE